jgi:glycosyltransferase involved in cell wall biosynthesis
MAIRWRRVPVWRAYAGVQPVPRAESSPKSRVSVIVPARNEERNIERCIRSLLSQSYESWELIVVDDGSTDATPAILARLAADSPRLRVLKAPPLPAGWVGKCAALAAGSAVATGDWLLFADADTAHEPGTLAAVISFAEMHGVDMLSLLTHQEMHTFWERTVLPTIFTSIAQAGSLAEVNDTRSLIAWANGQFILIRRATYDAIGGHAAIRSRVVEDFALAVVVKRQGHRLMLADGRAWVRTRMYESLRGIWDGFSKGLSSRRSRPLRSFVGAIRDLAAVVVPLGLLLVGAVGAARGSSRAWPALALAAGALMLGWQLAVGLVLARQMRIPAVYGLLRPLGIVVYAAIKLNAAGLLLTGRGVPWKGRRYNEAALQSPEAGPRELPSTVSDEREAPGGDAAVPVRSGAEPAGKPDPEPL